MIHIVKISSQRQITIPARMLEKLGVGKHDKLRLKFEDDKLVVESNQTVVNSLAGSMRKYISKDKLDKPWKEVRQKAWEIKAREIANEG